VKGIFAVSSLYMVQVTVIDYMMKVLAKVLLFKSRPLHKVLCETALILFCNIIISMYVLFSFLF